MFPLCLIALFAFVKATCDGSNDDLSLLQLRNKKALQDAHTLSSTNTSSTTSVSITYEIEDDTWIPSCPASTPATFSLELYTFTAPDGTTATMLEDRIARLDSNVFDAADCESACNANEECGGFMYVYLQGMMPQYFICLFLGPSPFEHEDCKRPGCCTEDIRIDKLYRKVVVTEAAAPVTPTPTHSCDFLSDDKAACVGADHCQPYDTDEGFTCQTDHCKGKESDQCDGDCLFFENACIAPYRHIPKIVDWNVGPDSDYAEYEKHCRNRCACGDQSTGGSGHASCGSDMTKCVSYKYDAATGACTLYTTKMEDGAVPYVSTKINWANANGEVGVRSQCQHQCNCEDADHSTNGGCVNLGKCVGFTFADAPKKICALYYADWLVED